MGKLRPLGRPFPSRYGTPVIARVDTDIFRYRYFTHCLDCTFCHDQCCDHGVDVDFVHLEAIERHAAALEAYTGMPRSQWFTDEYEEDSDYPGGGAVRTATRPGGGCVFLVPGGRGCRLHGFCLAQGLDYHELKSMTDCLFPISYYGDVLCPADEIADGELICMDTGPTLYHGLRDELAYYFGAACVARLDELEREVAAAA